MSDEAFGHQLVHEARRVAVPVNHASADVPKRQGPAVLTAEDAQNVELFRRDSMRLQQRTVVVQHGAGRVQNCQRQLLLR